MKYSYPHSGSKIECSKFEMLSIILYYSFRAMNQRLDSATVLKFYFIWNCTAQTGLPWQMAEGSKIHCRAKTFGILQD
jgi:hypothetical protein